MNLDIQHIRRTLLADKKKFSMLLTLFALGMLLWGRLLLTNVPRTATADPGKKNASAEGKQKSDKPADAPAEPTARRVIDVKVKSSVDRDLFNVNRQLFAKSTQDEPQVQAKSDPKPSDEKIREAVVEEARTVLKLQSTLVGMLGNRPKAMINGNLLEPGQTIQGFEILEIGSRHVTLFKNGVVVVLEM